MYYKVREVADMAGISIRMLHHYDQIGLLKPESVSPAGYRLYSEKDLARLQQVLFFKELDFSLPVIKTILDSPGFDTREALEGHRQMLVARKERLERIIGTVQKTIAAMERGMEMDKQDMFMGFDLSEIEKHQQKYAEEAKERWGHTEAYRESQAKTTNYTKEDWAEVMAEMDRIYRTLASLMDRDPADAEVQEAIEAFRSYISERFYQCPPEMLKGLGEMYVADPRFTANIDKYGKGLAAYMKDAMRIYAERFGKTE